MHKVSQAVLVAISASYLAVIPAQADDKSDCTGAKVSAKVESCGRLLSDRSLPKPQRVLYLGHRARGLIEARELDKAASDINAMFQLLPGSVFGHQARARLHEANDKFDLARSEHDLAVKLARVKYLPVIGRAAFLSRIGENDKAEADYAAAALYEPAKAQPHVGRGIILMRKGDTGKALEAFSRAIQVEPGFLNAYLERGAMHLEAKSFDLAMADFEKALSIDPTSAKATAGRQSTLDLKGAATPAALAVPPTASPPAPVAVPTPGIAPAPAVPQPPAPSVSTPAPLPPPATAPPPPNVVVAAPSPIPATGSPPKPSRKQPSAAPTEPLTPEQAAEVTKLFETASAAMKSKKPADAVAAYDAIRKIEPKNVHAALGRGRAFEDLGRVEDAAVAYGEAYDATKDAKLRSEAQLGIGRLNVREMNYAGGIGWLTQALALDPAAHEAMYWRSVAYHRSGRFELALKDSADAHALMPKNSNYLGRQALAQAMLGHREVATQLIANTLAMNAKNPHALTARAQLLLGAGDVVAAETEVRAVLAAFPAFYEGVVVGQYILVHKLFKLTDSPLQTKLQ
jgi:tetratricopeptide (TPR) repeat protein